MLGGIRFALGVRWCGLAAVLCVGSGCQPGSRLERAGISISPPAVWRSAARDRWVVPGTPLAAWEGPDGSSLVIYQGLPDPGGTNRGLVRQLATRLTNLPSVTLEDQGVVEVAGRPAARVELTAQGTGDSLAPSGAGTPVARPGRALELTRRVVVAIPRPTDTLTFVWHFPAAIEDYGGRVDEVLATLRLTDAPAMRSSY